jgi:hypothetical protein
MSFQNVSRITWENVTSGNPKTVTSCQTEKDPHDRVRGVETMTGAQRLYTLSEQADPPAEYANIFMFISGGLMWWKRRPAGAARLVAPAVQQWISELHCFYVGTNRKIGPSSRSFACPNDAHAGFSLGIAPHSA